ncbi:hypothetical protein [Nocardia xishanensis]|uniref:hypothetical protein n=1 Tax=Nocardia xishanensis TaxID=238964 RepID=UPI0012F4D52E|nr:hypothetical protein [Nocardia xishanensis]
MLNPARCSSSAGVVVGTSITVVDGGPNSCMPARTADQDSELALTAASAAADAAGNPRSSASPGN